MKTDMDINFDALQAHQRVLESLRVRQWGERWNTEQRLKLFCKFPTAQDILDSLTKKEVISNNGL